MSAEQIRAITELFLVIYMLVVTLGAWTFGHIHERKSRERHVSHRRSRVKYIKSYEIPKALPARPVRATRRINRRNREY